MNILVYSPLEQFEIFTIGAQSFSSFSFLDFFTGGRFFAIETYFDNLENFQKIFGLVYSNYLQNIPAIVIEGIGVDHTWFLEEYFIIQNFNIGFGKELNQNILIFFNDKEIITRLYKDPILSLIYYEYFYNNYSFERNILTNQINIFYEGTNFSILPEDLLNVEHYNIFWLNIYNSFIIVFVLFIFCFIYCNQINNNVKFYNIWIFAIDLLFNFLFETYSSLVDKRLLKYFPLFFVLFIFVFLSNLTALIPFSFCLTSNLWFTLTLSLSVWVGVTVLAIFVRGFEFFTAFVPANVPTLLKPFLTIIEIISYVARAVSLGVRIFANMLAGHSLVHILADLVETCIISFNSIEFKIFGLFPAIILTFIIFIEFGICFLQALVFVILTAIYLNEAFGFNSH